MGRSKEQIDQEYQSLCLSFGHLAQEKASVEEQRDKGIKDIQAHLEDFSAQAEGKLVQLDSELRKIAERWKELRVEIASVNQVSNPE